MNRELITTTDSERTRPGDRHPARVWKVDTIRTQSIMTTLGNVRGALQTSSDKQTDEPARKNTSHNPPNERDFQIGPRGPDGWRTRTSADINTADDEEVLHVLEPNVLTKTLVRWAALSIVTLGLAAVIAPIPVFLAWYRGSKERIIVTNERIVIKKRSGLFGEQSTYEFPIRDVTDIETSAGFVQRMANHGTVKFREHDGAPSSIEVDWIENPEAVASTLGHYSRRQSRPRYVEGGK